MRRQTGEPPGNRPLRGIYSCPERGRRAEAGFAAFDHSGVGGPAREGASGARHSFGRMPEVVCPLEPEILGTLARAGYAIERLTFQSRPGVRVTANLYRPDPVGKPCPAVLSVHGHWAWARMDPHVQPRGIALAKLGYVVLCVDAFGSGERAIEPGPGTYHGGIDGRITLAGRNSTFGAPGQ